MRCGFVYLGIMAAALLTPISRTYAYNDVEIGDFAGPFSSALENRVPTAPDAGIPGFMGAGERGAVADANAQVNPVFKAWAAGVVDYVPAPAANPAYIGHEENLPKAGVPAEYRHSEYTLGPVSGNVGDTCSLGDLYLSQIQALHTPENLAKDPNDPNKIQPGRITLLFLPAIADGPGPDFAVFENGLISGGGSGTAGEIFAELAYVEVSSDGRHFARFPSVSLTQAAVGAYGSIDPSMVYNLAGKHVNCYQTSWGTPFNLKELQNHPLVLQELVDLQAIRYVRLVDIPGSGYFSDEATGISDPRTADPNTGLDATVFDGNHGIYDAWVTMGSGGFDLEAVGIIDQIYGDANSDGRVDWSDFLRLFGHWQKQGYWSQGDFNEDGRVDTADLAGLAAHWLYEVPAR